MIRAALFAMSLLFALPALAAEDRDDLPRYVGFPVIIVNTSDGLNYNGLFAVKVQLQVTGEAAHEQLQVLRPQLLDALTQAMFRLGQLYIDPRKPLPWDRMMRELNTAVQRVSPKIPVRVLIMETTARATS